jgi:hypothetical protein
MKEKTVKPSGAPIFAHFFQILSAGQVFALCSDIFDRWMLKISRGIIPTPTLQDLRQIYESAV